MKRMLGKKWCSGRCPKGTGSHTLSDHASCSTSQTGGSRVSADLPSVSPGVTSDTRVDISRHLCK